jgi:hypothetical protein
MVPLFAACCLAGGLPQDGDDLPSGAAAYPGTQYIAGAQGRSSPFLGGLGAWALVCRGYSRGGICSHLAVSSPLKLVMLGNLYDQIYLINPL